MWNIIITSDKCSEHPEYSRNWKELCCLTEDGKCSEDKCPLVDKEYNKMKFLEKVHEITSRGMDPFDD